MSYPRHRTPPRAGLLLLVGPVVLAGAVSCSSTSTGSSGATTTDAAVPLGALDDRQIEAAAAAYAGFARINRAPFPTQQHAGNPQVNVYANATAAASYRALDPSAPPAAGFAFPAGSILVKEMLGAAGKADVLTVMYKKSPGYDPAHHDWWYGRLDPSGAPTQPEYAGTIDFCIACHEGTARSDYVWGVATGR